MITLSLTEDKARVLLEILEEADDMFREEGYYCNVIGIETEFKFAEVMDYIKDEVETHLEVK